MTTNQPNKRLFSGAAGTLALTARRATTLTVTRAAMLLLVMMLTTMTAWAATETRTVTFYMDGGYSGKTNLQDNWTLLNENGLTLYYSNTNQSDYISQSREYKKTRFLGNIDKNGAELIFDNLEGTVTKVELYNFLFYAEGIQMYVGKNKNNNATLMHLHGNNSDYDYPSDNSQTYNNKTATFESNGLDVSPSSPLKIMFSGSAVTGKLEFKGTITVTYEADVPADPQHTFTFNASGNTLTATCNNNGAGHECTLTNRQATLTLTADDVPYTGSYHNASYNLGEFMTMTGLSVTSGGIKYVNKDTGVERNTGPYEIGSYTARVTVTISNTDYTLTKDFNILAGYKVNNNYSQFIVSPTSALEGDEITITYTQQMDESLDGLTLTGATSGNNITYTQSGNTYTFNMPAEDVNLSATFTYPLNENNITQSGDTYTIKNADGWDYFCQRIQYDANLDGFSGKTVELAANISVTTMAGMVHPFKGTFDGKGNTLDFKPTTVTMYCAPFQNTNGATICNLHVEGLIEGGTNSYIGGLVGSSEGNLTIRDCHVSTQISTKYDSNTNSSNVGIGGIVGYIHYTTYGQKCQITGCVFDGLIYNPNSAGQTYGCGGFVGTMSQYAYVDLTDCLFIEGQYDNNGGKHELLWGHDNNMNSTFFHRSNNYGEGKLTNCFFVATHFLKQGSPAVESATAPANFTHFGDPTTDYGFLKVYGHTMVFGGKYYTPTYGDLVETYDFSGVKSYNIEYDDKPLGIPDIASPLWTSSLRYKRKFTAGKPVTVMLPFNFEPNDFRRGGEGDVLTGHFYDFAGIHLDPQTSKWMAEMNEVGSDDANEVTTMKANHPYLFVPTMSTVPHPYMNNLEYIYIENYSDGISIFTEGNEGGTKVKPYDGTADFAWNKWDFIGTYQPRYWYDGSDSEHPAENIGELGKVYGFAGSTKEVQGVYNNTITVEAGEFVRAKNGAKIRPTSCYLMWTGYEPDYARALTRGAAADEELPQRITVKLVSASGDLNAIGEIDTTTGEVSFEGWYTLDGVRLDGKPSAKGIYINNGKKVVIK